MMSPISSLDSGAVYAKIIAVSVVMLAVSTLSTILRLVSRWHLRRSTAKSVWQEMCGAFWWDDFVIVLAMIFSWPFNIGDILEAHHGLGMYDADIPAQDLNYDKQYQLKMLYSQQPIYPLVQGCIKISAILLYHRIFLPGQRWPLSLLIIAGTIIAWVFVAAFLGVFQCWPISAYWNPEESNAKCINGYDYFVGISVVDLVTDVLVVVWPWRTLWRLQMPISRKIKLIILFSLALFVTVICIIRIIELYNPHGVNALHNNANGQLWTAIGTSLGVMVNNLPPSSSLIRRILRGKRSNSVSSVTHPGAYSLSRQHNQQHTGHAMDDLEADETGSTSGIVKNQHSQHTRADSLSEDSLRDEFHAHGIDLRKDSAGTSEWGKSDDAGASLDAYASTDSSRLPPSDPILAPQAHTVSDTRGLFGPRSPSRNEIHRTTDVRVEYEEPADVQGPLGAYGSIRATGSGSGTGQSARVDQYYQRR